MPERTSAQIKVAEMIDAGEITEELAVLAIESAESAGVWEADDAEAHWEYVLAAINEAIEPDPSDIRLRLA